MNNNIGFDTLNALELFGCDESQFTKEQIILHIPHSSTFIPSYAGFTSNEAILNEISLLTDWFTDRIFKVDNVKSIVAKFSRVFCDVERLPDADEPMYEVGRGFFYTHGDKGNVLRNNDNGIKEYIYKNYYLKHHNALSEAVNSKLQKHNSALIIDCHSFNDIPFTTDIVKDTIRPDICIGTDMFHTPIALQNKVLDFFKSKGFTVSINSPYSGTIIPLEHYQINDKVKGIMIEINRKLYEDNNKYDNISELNKVFNELITYLN